MTATTIPMPKTPKTPFLKQVIQDNIAPHILAAVAVDWRRVEFREAPVDEIPASGNGLSFSNVIFWDPNLGRKRKGEVAVYRRRSGYFDVSVRNYQQTCPVWYTMLSGENLENLFITLADI